MGQFTWGYGSAAAWMCSQEWFWSSRLRQTLGGEGFDGTGQLDGVPAGVLDGTQRGAHALHGGHDLVNALGWGQVKHGPQCFRRAIDVALTYPGQRQRAAGAGLRGKVVVLGRCRGVGA
jgi:hypothetical protein